MDVVIKNGTVITATDSYTADVGLQNGRIVLIGRDLTVEASTVIDASGLFVLPGAIDAHVHLQLPVGKLVSADDCASGTRAAACGGVTSVFDFATPEKGQSLENAIQDRIAQFQTSTCIDYGLHGVITETGPDLRTQVTRAMAAGITSFKIYMVYPGLMVDDGGLADSLAVARQAGALICVHAENPALIDRRTRALLAEGHSAAWYHYESRPEFVEAEAVSRAIQLAKAMSAPLYIVHLACREGLEAVTRARDEGCIIHAETCPHYLNFTHDVYQRADGRLFVCSPSIKGQDSQDALWAGIVRGDIETVATDHCPFQSFEKDLGAVDFTKIPNGCMGVEILYPFMLHAASQGRITYNKAVEVCSTNVARIFGCAPQKGTIAVGSDADIVIYDPIKPFVVSQANMHSTVDYTIWEGTRFSGSPVMVFSRGRLVSRDGHFQGEAGWGQLIRCH